MLYVWGGEGGAEICLLGVASRLRAVHRFIPNTHQWNAIELLNAMHPNAMQLMPRATHIYTRRTRTGRDEIASCPDATQCARATVQQIHSGKMDPDPGALH
eukprot:12968835-Heterocapsa_arctica.AAC.1